MGDPAPVRDNLASLLEAVGDAVSGLDPQRRALVHGDRHRTWREFDDRASRLAGYLAEAGTGPGDRVGIGLYNSPEYLESLLAVLKLRAVPVNVNYRYREAELEQVLELADVRALVVDATLAAKVGAVAQRSPRLRSVLLADGEAAGAPPQGWSQDTSGRCPARHPCRDRSAHPTTRSSC
ncbi:AMP-binding protein [Blastococcus brunescens]|uniref:AMP-binding protein n=1 Tax=Blastococcus brunescens TaxID=1564165 RepID=A0ABZ1AWB6_9ACTN|nr:AMP-binding protein [Blastococcus sp. BMG 8361]WRL62859.1 AMP-binding protein [Blastococcus sp. BMG 8361]